MSPDQRDSQQTASECQRRMRFLEWLRVDGNVLDSPVVTLKVDAVLGPCLKQDFDAFLHAAATLLLADAVTEELHGTIAAAEADGQAAAAKNIDGGCLLGQAQRMMEGDDVHGDGEADTLGARGDGREQDTG